MTKTNTNLTQKILCVLLLISSSISFAQLAVPFKVRHQGYVNGDITMIANNIVNRVDYYNKSNVDYNNRSSSSKLNDEFTMDYIDIDDDSRTFSSSTADLVLENQDNKKIIYAGLYWSATYLYNSGTNKGDNKFKSIDGNRDEFNTIKLKLPNQSNYSTIKGQLIFDGIKKKKFKESAPYAMYADITKLVEASENPYGTYTVADVKSTIGKISGGISAGWTIFFIYEDATMPRKYITTFDGFAGVTNNAIDVEFTGFQTLPQGDVNAKIACMALEGDLNLSGDQLFVNSDFDKKFSLLSNSYREKTNMFNSSITLYNKPFTSRFPNSLNTLGYDSFIMNIENPNNSVIHNNAQSVALRLKTYGDRYYVFFSAFAVEVTKPKEVIDNAVASKKVEKAITNISNPDEVANVETTKPAVPNTLLERAKTKTKEKKEKNNEVAASVDDPNKEIEKVSSSTKQVEKKDVAVLETKPSTTIENEKVAASNVKQTASVEVPPKVTKTKTTVTKTKQPEKIVAFSETKKTETSAKQSLHVKPENTQTASITKTAPVESPSTLISNLPQGYYIIVNVFAIHSNATRFVDRLNKLGLKANYFFNPLNNYRYVYLSKHDNFDEAYKLYASNINGKYKDAAWIMTVNKDNNSEITLINHPTENNTPFVPNQNLVVQPIIFQSSIRNRNV